MREAEECVLPGDFGSDVWCVFFFLVWITVYGWVVILLLAGPLRRGAQRLEPFGFRTFLLVTRFVKR